MNLRNMYVQLMGSFRRVLPTSWWMGIALVLVTFSLMNPAAGQKFQYSRGWMPGGKRAQSGITPSAHFRYPLESSGQRVTFNQHEKPVGFAHFLVDLLERQEDMGKEDIQAAVKQFYNVEKN